MNEPDMELIVYDTMETKVFLKQRIETAMSQGIDRLEARRKGCHDRLDTASKNRRRIPRHGRGGDMRSILEQ